MATYVVTSLLDSGAGSLRTAITSANSNTGSTINFGALSGTITLASALPTIVYPTTINGSGATVTISGASTYPIFNVNASGTVVIEYLTLINAACAILQNSANTVTISNCAFNNNSNSGNGGAICATSGVTGTTAISNCTFTGNSASGNGAAVFTYYGPLTCSNSTFTGNSTSALATVFSLATGVTISDCTFVSNTGVDGAGVYIELGTMTVTDCTFVNNTSSTVGILTCNSGTLTVLNCTASGNTVTGAVNTISGTTTVKNSIVYGNTGAAVDAAGGTTTITYSCIQGGYSGTGNISTNPRLGSIAINGGTTATIALGLGSPCIGTGTATGAPTNSQNGATFASPPNMGAWSYIASGVTSGTAAVAIADMVNSLVDPARSTYKLNPAGNYQFVVDGYSVIDNNAAGIANTLTYDTIGGSRITSYDSSGYLVSSTVVPSAIPFLQVPIPTENASTGIETTMGNYINHLIDPTGATYSLNPGGSYRTTLDGGNIKDLNGSSVVINATFDTVGGTRINSYDANNYLVASIFTPA